MTTAAPRLRPGPMPAGFHAFWFWNARISAEGIRDQFESALLTQTAAGRGAGQPDISRRTLRDPLTVSLAGTWTMRPCSPNVLPLQHWHLHVTEPERAADDGGPVEADPVVTPAPLANQLCQGTFRWAPRILIGCAEAIEIAFGPGPWHRLPWSPRRMDIPAAELATASAVRVRVYSGLARAFEGRWFDPTAHRYRLIGAHDDGTSDSSATGSPSPRPQRRRPL